MNVEQIKEALSGYSGAPLRLMEICGTHTAEVAKSGIPSLLPESIRLISGPGCPVCVTVTAYIDRLVELSLTPGYCVVSFGDLLRVRGSGMSLSEAKAAGGSVRMVYSPMEIPDMAGADKDKTFVFAAVGFETTAPVYALMIKECLGRGTGNVKLLTSLKTMPRAVEAILGAADAGIDGFLAPGHVCAVTGYHIFEEIAERYSVPFVVAGFKPEQLLAAIYRLASIKGEGRVENLYTGVVTREGNRDAQAMMEEFFSPCDAAWRGLGIIPGSGLKLKEKYVDFDMDSESLTEDRIGGGCCCAEVLTGRKAPWECPLFAGACTPQDPRGACMVSQEGSCYNYYISGRR